MRGRRGPPAPLSALDRHPASWRVLEVQARAQLGAVEPSVSARGGEGGVKPSGPDGAVEGRLADSKKARGLARGQQAGAVGLVLQSLGKGLDVPDVEPPVT